MSPLRMLLFRLSNDNAFLLRFLADPEPIYAAYHLTPDEVARVEQRSSLWLLLLGATPPASLKTPTPDVAPSATGGETPLLRGVDDDTEDDGGGGGDDDDGDDDDDDHGDDDDDDDDDDDHPPQPTPQPRPPINLTLPPLPEPPTPLFPPLPPTPPPQPLFPPIHIPEWIPTVIPGQLGGKPKLRSSPLSEKAVSLATAARTTSGEDRLNNVRAMLKEL